MSTGLVLDLYHIDSSYVAWRHGMNEPATFDLYTRSNPLGGAYLLVAGLDAALAFVRDFRYESGDIAYLRSLGRYGDDFLRALESHRFTGEILAMPEGTIGFPDEPLVRVTAPFREALLLESGLLYHIGLSTLVATKAARVVRAAAGRPIAEFGLRRSQEPMAAARAAAIGGCATTSFLGAARSFGLPPSGTIPHALVQAFPSEEKAFSAVAESLQRYTLLLDTYDVHRGIDTAVEIARRARARWGHELHAVRLDSGDIAADARHCRKVLDAAGLRDVRIFASGELDEHKIDAIVRSGAPIDAFGVGTSIGVGLGSPEHGVPGGALPSVYKLAAYGDPPHPVMKIAHDKSTWPGRKAVWRVGAFVQDVIALDDEPPPARAAALLEPARAEPLEAIRERARSQLDALPERYHALADPPVYPVRRSTGLVRLREETLRDRGLA